MKQTSVIIVPAFRIGDIVYPHYDYGCYDGAREVRAVRTATSKDREEISRITDDTAFMYRLAGGAEWRAECELGLACPIERLECATD